MDLTKLSGPINLTNAKHVYSLGYTMGFWFFSSKADLTTNVIKLTYENNMMITISTDTTLFSHCFIGLEFYDFASVTDTAANLKAYYAAGDSTNMNMAKSPAIDDKKWRYIRCAYSYDNKKYYIDVNKEGFTTAVTPTDMIIPQYYKTNSLTYPFRYNQNNPKLIISGANGISGASIFVRNLVFFADYIHPAINIHY